MQSTRDDIEIICGVLTNYKLFDFSSHADRMRRLYNYAMENHDAWNWPSAREAAYFLVKKYDTWGVPHVNNITIAPSKDGMMSFQWNITGEVHTQSPLTVYFVFLPDGYVRFRIDLFVDHQSSFHITGTDTNEDVSRLVLAARERMLPWHARGLQQDPEGGKN